jgi:type II secretory pathway pseudopilin PulG
MKHNQKGFSLIEGLLLVIAIALVAGVGYYVYSSNKKTNESLNNASKVSQSTALPPTSAILYKVKELGIEFKLPDSLKGLYYNLDTDGSSVAFFMNDLNSAANKCEDKGPYAVNTWVKVDGTYDDEPGTGLIKQFDKFYVKSIGRASGRICSDSKVQDLVLKYSQALDTASKGVEQIK